MKPIQFISALIFLVLFPIAFYAADPETISNKMITKLSNDVTLTDSQKAMIKVKTIAFFRKIQNSDPNKSIEEKIKEHQQFTNEYKMALDSVLTAEQKELLIQKQNEHKQAIIDRYLKNQE